MKNSHSVQRRSGAGRRTRAGHLCAAGILGVALMGAAPAQAQFKLDVQVLRAELTKLQLQRLKALQNHKSNSAQVRKIDAQINGARQLLAQNLPDPNSVRVTEINAVDNAAGAASNTVGQVTNQVPGAVDAAGRTVGQLGNTVGNTAGTVVGGLQPTLQPVGQGVGNALNNLTQPDTVSALLEFLAGVIPNHIEAHVNLDSLRVEKLTVDVRGVDLRNLRVDLLVANSRNAGQVRPVLGSGARGTMTPGAPTTAPRGTTGGASGNGGFSGDFSGRAPGSTTPAPR